MLTCLLAEMYHAKQNIQYVFFKIYLETNGSMPELLISETHLLVFLDIPFEILKYFNSV